MQLYIHKSGSELQGLTYLEHYIWGLKDGTYQFDIRRARNPKTKQQRGWLWNYIYPTLLEALIDAGWEFTNVNEVHEFFKYIFKSHRVINRFTGEVIEIPESTADMDTVEYSTYCEKLRDYAREYLNIEINEPDRDWKVK